MSNTLLSVLSVSLLCAALPSSSAFTLTGDAVLVIPDNITSGEYLAYRDVQRDFYIVTGLVGYSQSGYPAPNSLPAGTVVVYFGNEINAPWINNFGSAVQACYSGWESHCVVAIPAASSPNGYDSIIATGTGMRGGIFGAYSFSELILGVNPWYRFTDDVPTYQNNITVSNTFSQIYNPPQFKYRSWFPNDEDLLGGHNADPAGQDVFSLTTWDELCETLLRIKANAMLIGTNPYPDENSVALVSRRGVVIQHHHYDILGMNVYQWPLGSADWNWLKNTATMAYGWQASIEAQKSYEIIWSVGLRGLNDYSYSCNGNTDCGNQISEAVGNQTQWVMERAGPDAQLVLYMWDELLELLVGGYLRIPSNVHIIFTDTGAGYILVNKNVTQYANGAYYHTAMYNGNANQLSEMIPADRIFAQIAAFIQYANTTTYFIDNLSDLRPALMTTDAVFRMIWDPTPYTQQDPNTTARNFYADWAQRQLHVDTATATTFSNIWFDYFALPFIQNAQADNFLCGRIQSFVNEAANDYHSSGKISGKTVNDANSAYYQMGGNTTSAGLLSLFNQAQALVSSIPANRVPFYTAHTLVNFATDGYLANAIVLAVQAINQVNSGDIAGATASMATALENMDIIFSLRRTGEYGKWAGFWMTDHLSDVQLSRKTLRRFYLQLTSNTQPLAPLTPYMWYEFYNYQNDFKQNWPYIHYNPQWNLATYVRINCVWSDVDAGICATNATGGIFTSNSNAAITMQILTSATVNEESAAVSAPGLAIYYTTDGTDPNSSSSVYVPGQQPVLSKLGNGQVVHIRAMAYFDGVATGQITDAVFVAM